MALLASCATNPVPSGYTGPIATVFDSGEAEDRSRARMFVLAEVDGAPIDHSVKASARASSGQGPVLTTVFVQRAVPARPMKVKIIGTHTTAAPIQAIAARIAGTYFSVEAVVDFDPQPDARYVIKGELKKEGSSVWIEDQATGKAVTPRR